MKILYFRDRRSKYLYNYFLRKFRPLEEIILETMGIKEATVVKDDIADVYHKIKRLMRDNKDIDKIKSEVVSELNKLVQEHKNLGRAIKTYLEVIKNNKVSESMLQALMVRLESYIEKSNSIERDIDSNKSKSDKLDIQKKMNNNEIKTNKLKQIFLQKDDSDSKKALIEFGNIKKTVENKYPEFRGQGIWNSLIRNIFDNSSTVIYRQEKDVHRFECYISTSNKNISDEILKQLDSQLAKGVDIVKKSLEHCGQKFKEKGLDIYISEESILIDNHKDIKYVVNIKIPIGKLNPKDFRN